MPLQATSGAASYDAFGGGVAAVPNYIEDVFSTWLYTGNGNATLRTISNGMDFSSKGGAAFIKNRSAVGDCVVTDTARGARNPIFTSQTAGQDTNVDYAVNSFLSNGFTLATTDSLLNTNGSNYVAWSFLEQAKFFDVVTFTTNSSGGATVPHNLGSTPGFVIAKSTSGTSAWTCWHRGLTSTNFEIRLNSTAAQSNVGGAWITPSSTDVVFSSASSNLNASQPYVMYVFAHNAGGFGLTGTDNVISCGSYTGTGATGNNVTLGYEPQWVMIKAAERAQDWFMFDTMRGMTTVGSNEVYLLANTSDAESGSAAFGINPTATGFGVNTAGSSFNASGEKYIYIAIRRGPMKVPTTGTSVFGLNARTGTNANATVTGSAGVTDLAIIKSRGPTTVWAWASRLTGTGYLSSNATTAEVAAGTTILQANPWDVMDGVKVGTSSPITNDTGRTYINYLLDRAPSFFDVVCYTGTGVARTVAHNLAAVPEMYIVKPRGTALASNDWWVNCAYLPTPSADSLVLNSTGANNTGNGALLWNSTLPTSSVFSLGTYNGVNTSGTTFVAYLFATCPGVSKVFNYTGNGSSQTINCGFTAGSRFVMIKRTDSTGDWYVWDSARGIVAGNDPRLSLNSTAAEVTTDDSVDTDSTGFVVNQLAATNVNVNAATYIGIAIA